MNTAKRAGLFSIVIAVVLAAGGAAMAGTFVISPDGLGDYPTIQAAVLAATDGDIIELTDGTFTGDGNRDIAVPSRPITIRSQSGNCMDCVIDCQGSARAEHRGFRFETAVGTGDVTLEDIGIINGYVTDGGGGIWIVGASPRIEGCAISMCTVAGFFNKGGGIYVSDGGYPDVFFCLISQNTADYGGGVAVVNAEGMFQSCDITDNEAIHTAGGVYISANGDVAFWYCDIVSNTAERAGGVRMGGTAPSLQSCNVSRNEATAGHSGGVWLQGGGFVNCCTIVENSATEGGGGVHCEFGTGGLNQCIIAFTEAGYGVGASAGDVPSLDCCDVYENAGGNYDAEVGDQTGFNDNFSLDPEFCNRDFGDYRLFDTSPCLDTNSPCDLLVGCTGQGCDSPVEEMSWGRLKGLWR